MASRIHLSQIKNQIFASAFLFILLCTFALPNRVYALNVSNTFPTLSTFIETVKNGKASALRGVYVSNTMALSIEQQPAGNPGYVSNTDNVATQFNSASQVGNIGLLAHNTHAGGLFSSIKIGDKIILVFGDGHTETFIVSGIQRFQALNSQSIYSQFKDIETQTTYSANNLFNKEYRGDYHLTLQTCIMKSGDPSWGRLFITAIPVEKSIVLYK